jgi:hypothetical protein
MENIMKTHGGFRQRAKSVACGLGLGVLVALPAADTVLVRPSRRRVA